jgi:hypothetical protein
LLLPTLRTLRIRIQQVYTRMSEDTTPQRGASCSLAKAMARRDDEPLRVWRAVRPGVRWAGATGSIPVFNHHGLEIRVR